MRKIKVFCAVCAAVAALSMSACSIVDSFTGNTTDETTETDENSAAEGNKLTADKSLQVPQFTEELVSPYPIVMGSKYTLDGTATVTDGGEVRYQWYVNNVESNGGGTKIQGATEAEYTPDTSETGIKFYYVVAENVNGSSFNMTTSKAVRIEVRKKGQWTEDEYGGIRYLSEDGTYPSSLPMIIDDDIYYFEQNGYRYSGWVYWGYYYFFDEEGKMARDTKIYSYEFDKNGRYTGTEDPLGILAAQADAAAAAGDVNETAAKEQ